MSADILRDLTELVYEGHLHGRQDVLDGPFPRRRQPGRLVALPQAAGVHEVLRVRPRVVLVEADGPDGLDGWEDRHHLGAPLDLGVSALLDIVGALPVAVSRG